jgi:Holliday junction resolvase
MTKYEKGVRFEREVVNIFKKAGYTAVRTAGSHSPYDVIIWKDTGFNKKIANVAFIQCKVKTTE